MKRIKLKGNHFDLHPSGAAFWVETLLLADVHLGKVAHFRKNGIAVPRKAEGVFYEKITLLLNEFRITSLFRRSFPQFFKTMNGICLPPGLNNKRLQ